MSDVKGLISKIQRYSTKDGPGLRSTVFMVGCNLKCVWCANPELIDSEPQILYYAERCKKCGRCASVAENNSIIVTEKGCRIDRKQCVNIEECAKQCFYDAYETVGYQITVHELVEKLIRDEVFFEHSGGGVTFSGGEAALQYAFVLQAAQLLQQNRIHVALDTAGLIPWDRLYRILEYIDLVLFDIKAFDSKIHKNCTGVDNSIILENAQKIAEIEKSMIVRMVIVPNMNDQMDDICARFEFIKKLGSVVQQVDILKYHKLGYGKYILLGKHNRLIDNPECSLEFISEVKRIGESIGLITVIGG